MDTTTQPGHLVAGRYRLIAEIGSGGFGRVWEAQDEQLNRAVAVKEVVMPLLPPAQQEQRLAQARREGENAAALSGHPNIVTVHDVIIEAGAPWIVMQLVRGRSLRDTLRSDPDDPDKTVPLDVERVAKVAESVLAALRHAHESDKRILHRDVKPANIMIADDGQVLLTDFGLAKAETDSTLTVSGSVMGTMAYIAPERAEGENATIKSDLFSLGVTLFEAVEGVSPFYRDTQTATLTAILVKPLPPMQHAGRLAPLIKALTLKSPSERPDAEQAAALLEGTDTAWKMPSSDDQDTEVVPSPIPPGNRTKTPWQSVSLAASAGLPRPALIDTPQPTAKAPEKPQESWAGAVVLVLLIIAGIVGWNIYQHKKDEPSGGGHPFPTPTSPVFPSYNPITVRTTSSPPTPTLDRYAGCGDYDKALQQLNSATNSGDLAAHAKAYSDFSTSLNDAAIKANDTAVRTALEKYAGDSQQHSITLSDAAAVPSASPGESSQSIQDSIDRLHQLQSQNDSETKTIVQDGQDVLNACINSTHNE